MRIIGRFKSINSIEAYIVVVSYLDRNVPSAVQGQPSLLIVYLGIIQTEQSQLMLKLYPAILLYISNLHVLADTHDVDDFDIGS